MILPDQEYPCLRPLEALPEAHEGRILLRDPTGLAQGALAVGAAQFMLLTLIDGTRGRLEIQSEFARRTGQLLLSGDLQELLDQLEAAGFLAGPGFDSYYSRLVESYRRMPHRPLRDPDSFGAPRKKLSKYLDGILAEAAAQSTAQPPRKGRLAGIVAPHLDFPRGSSCYGPGYHHARRADAPQRVVVLGTNHFGQSESVVATGKDFETHWGVVSTDRDFLGRLQAECGGNLMPYELDHLQEHSIELQVVWLHHVFGNGIRIVPFLCPDPTGPNGTRPGDPDGVDLRQFARALGHLLRNDPTPTLLIASADLSHVGGYFGDDREVDDCFMQAVRSVDEAGLAHVDRNEPEAYREHMARTKNPTRVCSVGCLYALMTALGPEAQAHRLHYHQAVTKEIENAVTCAAYAFYLG
jgi:MEMO1 family protein